MWKSTRLSFSTVITGRPVVSRYVKCNSSGCLVTGYGVTNLKFLKTKSTVRNYSSFSYPNSIKIVNQNKTRN